MKLLYLCAPTALAGAERVILSYFEHHSRQSLTICCLAYINHRRLDNPFIAAVKNLGIPLQIIELGRGSLVDELRQTVAFIKANGIELLHTHGYRADVAGFVASRFTGTPIISTVHGWTPVDGKLKLYEAIDRWCLRRFNKVICVSQPLYDGLHRYGINKERLVMLPNAVPLFARLGCDSVAKLRNEIGLAVDERVILSVGRLSPEKGIDVLLESFRALLDEYPENVRLVIVGDGPLRGELESCADGLGISRRVIFTGYRDDVKDFYAVADLFVLSSHSEGTPMALLEAMVAGLPVVGTRVGGVPDIVTDGVDGLLVDAGDPLQLGRVMGKILLDRQLAAVLGMKARETVETRYSVDLWLKGIEGVYREIFISRGAAKNADRS